jgi:hypothetical protein
VFLVNGQRQEALDNTFIVQQLGFKYLRKRMMVIVDVDGMRPEALGELMQGSRQGFYRGRVWDAIHARLIATLKADPELQKLEEEAEAEVSELQAGDQKVKDALDALIESHHHYADHVVTGKGGESGLQNADDVLGGSSISSEPIVSLLSDDQGQPSEYPVLISQPDTTALWLRPDIERTLTITSEPENAWAGLAGFTYAVDSKIPELHIAEDRLGHAVNLKLRFDPPDDFDTDDYPVRTTLRAFARFDGHKEPRQLAIALTMKPPTPVADPVLFDEPTFIKVSTRQPVRLWLGSADTHVRLRWNGKDDLALGPSPKWTFKARCLTATLAGPTTFSQPKRGRFSLLVSLTPNAQVGHTLQFEIIATGPDGKTLTTTFEAVVAEKPQKSQPEPRLIDGNVPSGASRRPPYDLKLVEKEKWDNGTAFGGNNWTAEDAAAFQEPTEKRPLTLIINKDFGTLEAFRNYLVGTKKLTENEVKTRLQKYNSHVYYHLYQMYQSAQSLVGQPEDAPERPPTPKEQRSEVNRVSMTLLKLMQVSR